MRLSLCLSFVPTLFALLYLSLSPPPSLFIAHYIYEQSVRDIFDMMAQAQQHAREMQDDIAFELNDEVLHQITILRKR